MTDGGPEGRERAERRGLVQAAGVVGGATLLSRVLGLVRDSVTAFFLGATPAADAFFVAFRIPNLMRQLFGEGALASSFVPVYTDARVKRGEEQAARLADSLFSLLLAVLVVLCAAGTVFAPWVVRIMALGFAPGSPVYEQTVLLTRWMFPYVLLVCLAAFSGGILNAHRHFLTPALSPSLLNLSMILFALGLSSSLGDPALALAFGVLLGGALQYLIQEPPLARLGIRPRVIAPHMTPEVRRVFLLMGPAVLGVTVYQVNMLVDTLMASFLPTGHITYLWYGNRMMQFPLGVFGIALATAALPTLSSQVSSGRDEDFRRTVSFSLALTAFIGFPSALGLMALREPIMATLFARGAFLAQDVRGAAATLLTYAAGLPFFIAVKILGRAFFAREDTRTPFLAAVVAMLSNVALNLLLIRPLQSAGLALATTMASALNFVILALVFTRREGRGWAGRTLTVEVVRSLVSSLVMAGAAVAVASRLDWMGSSAAVRALWLSGCVALGIVVYSLAALASGSECMKSVKNRIVARIKG